MTKIYTSDEIDEFLQDIRSSLATCSLPNIDLEDLKKKYNELFGSVHDCKNRIDLLDAKIKEKEKKEKEMSPYARRHNF